MKLTGKCKEDFDKWLIDQVYGSKLLGDVSVLIGTHLTEFKNFPYAMQYGVYVDFFDSIEIEIEVTKWDSDTWQCLISNEKTSIAEEIYDLESRQEARTKAIEKANDIYNES